MVDELARLGFSVNYRRVMYLEMKIGLSFIQQFTDEGVVSPPGLRRGLFTVGDTDTIDHNPSSTTSANSLSLHCYIVVSSTYYRGRWAEERHTVVPSGQDKLTLAVFLSILSWSTRLRTNLSRLFMADMF